MRFFATAGLALIAASAAPGQLPYESEIFTWVAQDALNPPPDDALLFVGSSSIRRWEHLSRDFAEWDVIQRGFGGSTFADLNLWVNQIVLPYDPAAIVVFEGTNDVAAGRSASRIFNDYLQFISLVRGGQSSSRPPIPILYIGITPTPARWASWATASAVNAMIETHTQSDPSLFYIDTPSVFLATGSPPSSSLFVADGLHLNTAGYALWSQVIEDSVRSVEPPTKTYAANPRHPSIGSRILFDFGPSNALDGTPTASPDANGNHWNNWHAVTGSVGIDAGQHIGDLVAADGVSTGIDLILTGGYSSNGLRNGGLVAPSASLLGDLAIGTATQDYFFFNGDDTTGGFMLRGLDRRLTYEFRLFGSRDTTEVRVTRYLWHGSCPDVVGDLQTSGPGISASGVGNGNDDDVLVLTDVHPDRFGQLFLDMQRLAASFGYLNAMEIVVREPNACLRDEPLPTHPTVPDPVGAPEERPWWRQFGPAWWRSRFALVR